MDPANSIVIRLEVQIPVAAGASIGAASIAPVSISGPAVAHHGKHGEGRSITHPKDTAKVKVVAGYTSGVICAAGQAPLSDPYGLPPIHVKIKIYPDLSAVPPDEPPVDAMDLGPADAYGFWGIDEVGTANCAPTGYGVDNRFVVWYQYYGVATRRDSKVFRGLCSETTDNCNGQFGQPPPVSARVPTVIVPQWDVVVGGFGGEGMGVFDGAYELTVDSKDGRPFLWTSLPKRARDPRLELYLTVPCFSRWKLVFMQGERRVEYSMPAAEWDQTGTNIFTGVKAHGLPPDASLPASVVVVPVKAPVVKPRQDQAAPSPRVRSAPGNARRRTR